MKTKHPIHRAAEKRLKPRAVATFAGLLVLLALHAADLPEWPYRQDLDVPGPGLIKLDLPVATLDLARPDLADLRILDPAGVPLPHALERPQSVPKLTRAAWSHTVSLNPNATIITAETGFPQPLEAISLETPVADFIKSVKVEGSADRQGWRVLGTGHPIFRRSGAAQLRVPLPGGAWPFLRLTVDDQRTEAVPFTGVRVHAAEVDPGPQEPLPVSITERVENPGETRLVLGLGAANLTLASLNFDTPDPLFTRRVRFLVREISENAIREKPVGEGVIYRVALEGRPVSTQLTVSVEATIPARELVVLIQNDDSPPLQIHQVSAQRRPVYAVFQARTAGQHALLMGYKQAAVPRYDVTALGANFRSAPVSSLRPAAPRPNPAFRPPVTLPEVADAGALLDVKPWRFRKPIQLARAGVQQVELDLDVLAHALPGFGDLRVVRDGQQLPYVIEHTSITRMITPMVTLANDPKRPKLTRWSLKLPKPRLPVDRLVCETSTPLFRRDLRLYEKPVDDRGREYERPLGHATWTQTPERKSRQLTLTLNAAPVTDTLFLETDNGDNPPIELVKFEFHHPATRLLFKTASATPLHLYYGHGEAAVPSYDLRLVAGQLLAADKTVAPLGSAEQLRKAAWREGRASTPGHALFWAILGVVVIGLLLVITKLLPRSGEATSR